MGVFLYTAGQSGARIQAHTHTRPHRRADPLNSTNIDYVFYWENFHHFCYKNQENPQKNL